MEFPYLALTGMKRTPITRKTRLRPVSAKRTAYRASDEGQNELRYMGAVKQLPCCTCGAPPPNDAHHCYHDRYGTRKESGFDTIPLCHDGCHQGPRGVHAEKRSWRARHGPDHGYIDETRAKVFALTGVDFVPTR